MSLVRPLRSFIVVLTLAAFGTLGRADFNSQKLPAAFQKNVPETLKDLQEIEEHVKKLVAKVTASTVGLQIGGASGSGVIVKDGYILTAGHVSGMPGRTATIILPDGKRIKGKTLGANRAIDSGMIQITDKGEWPHVELATGDLKKGHWCLAVGHPKGYYVGRSPVVRLGRVLEINKGYLRTDCTLVGGDSGGPLFDMHGNVIGIHSRIGPLITFNIHVPVTTYRETWDKLAQSEVWGNTMFGPKAPKASNVYLGLRTFEEGAQLKIERVVDDSPAAKAGIMANDILVSIDGKKLGTNKELEALLSTKRPGNVIALEVRRGEKTLSLEITLSKRPG